MLPDDPLPLILGFCGILFLIWFPFHMRSEAKKTRELNLEIEVFLAKRDTEQEYQDWIKTRTGELWEPRSSRI